MITMNAMLASCLSLALVAVARGQDAGGSAPTAADPGWPRTFSRDGSTVVLHQPQIDGWDDQTKIRFRMALEVTPAGASAPDIGVASVNADTHYDSTSNVVLFSGLQATARFPGMPEAEATPLQALVAELLPSTARISISLDRVLACMHDQKPPPPVAVSIAPPPIDYSDVPAILVVYIGPPRFQPVPGTQLMFAVNTNWTVLLDGSSGHYYLLDGSSWLTSSDPVGGSWTAATSLPTDQLAKLPAGAQWDGVRSHVPGEPFATVPRVFAHTQPAELIVTDGPPEYSPLVGTGLMYVSNPVMPLFMELSTGSYYHLVAGRWFRAPAVQGPWTAASNDLPAEFARIPADCPVGSVLTSIPGTQESRDAVLLASVAHKATVDTASAKVNVSYDGPPQFRAIDGTSMQYAVNTTYEVINASGSYWCCYQAVWFGAPTPEGPWTVATSLPPEIATIPPTCPVYNVTYVRIYDSSPDSVVVGYTGGYNGEYVADNGALMYGAGVIVLPVDDCDTCWSCCSPCYYSYGCNAYYHCATGAYVCGNAYYGPHGGAGWASAYNPATGSWVRGGYAYGPCGSYGFHEGYNASTDTWGAHASGHNGYESWGSTAVSQGDRWAQANHVTNANGVTHGWAETSSGQSAQAVHAGNTTVGATSSGDLYAGHDGNAYRRTSDGTWQSYDRGSGWQDTTHQPQASAPAARPAAAPMAAPAGNAMASSWSGGQQNPWAAHDTQSGLEQDSFARNLGQANAASRWGGGQSFAGQQPAAQPFGGDRFGGQQFGGFRGRR